MLPEAFFSRGVSPDSNVNANKWPQQSTLYCVLSVFNNVLRFFGLIQVEFGLILSWLKRERGSKRGVKSEFSVFYALKLHTRSFCASVQKFQDPFVDNPTEGLRGSDQTSQSQQHRAAACNARSSSSYSGVLTKREKQTDR